TLGDLASAIYSLNYGQGAATVDLRGRVETDGFWSDGVIAYTAGAGAARVTAADTAAVTVRGPEAAGIWAVAGGSGEARVDSAASVRTEGDGSSALVAQVGNSASSADASVTLRERGSVSTSGQSSHGL